ncbi:hypothetical protein LQ948_04785 [Jiella sp. MQZ9-1]|uniref:Uncharacterized protein n=1 Tax=Jiella flava TaxID=2816857 RepID=A0A939JTI0_9HYPH|nr:hypothetical protein [Jiella flava]MBO0662150.1 hypothetical protein [Jiella flava]MCD2470521.1 hypothetical protein [Jiella flava]
MVAALRITVDDGAVFSAIRALAPADRSAAMTAVDAHLGAETRRRLKAAAGPGRIPRQKPLTADLRATALSEACTARRPSAGRRLRLDPVKGVQPALDPRFDPAALALDDPRVFGAARRALAGAAESGAGGWWDDGAKEDAAAGGSRQHTTSFREAARGGEGGTSAPRCGPRAEPFRLAGPARDGTAAGLQQDAGRQSVFHRFDAPSGTVRARFAHPDKPRFASGDSRHPKTLTRPGRPYLRLSAAERSALLTILSDQATKGAAG